MTESELDPHWTEIERELGIHITPEHCSTRTTGWCARAARSSASRARAADRARRLHRLRLDPVRLRVQPEDVAADHDDPARVEDGRPHLQ
jgi:hypothetical protein